MIWTASGMPLASVMRWRLDPGRPRSVGLGPVFSPPFSPARTHCPGKPGASRWLSLARAGPRARGGAGPRRQPPATPASAASRSCPSRSPSPRAASPKAGQIGARTGRQSGPPGPAHGVGRPWAWAARPTTAAQQPPIDHRKEEVSPCRWNRRGTTSVLGSVRRCKPRDWSRRAAPLNAPRLSNHYRDPACYRGRACGAERERLAHLRNRQPRR